jgi:Leucine-rich repeat (LRR) protein
MLSLVPGPSKSEEEVQFENGPFGCRAVIKGRWSEELREQLCDAGVVELELNHAKGWDGDDLTFLAGLTDLQSFTLIDFRVGSLAPVHSLHNLRSLTLITYSRSAVDFSAFPNLEDCALEWNRSTPSLFDAVRLKRLFVNRYRGHDVTPFSNLKDLESLAILNSPIESIEGLSALAKLRELRLGRLIRLGSLDGMEALHSLEDLDVSTCRSIDSIKELSKKVRLKRLCLSNDGGIESLRPIKDLLGLEQLVFDESTNILDGDLTPLLNLTNLRRLAFQNRRHYTHRREEFIAYRDPR